MISAECDAQEDVGYLLFHDFQAITTSVPIKLIGIDQLVCNTYCTQNIVRYNEEPLIYFFFLRNFIIIG